MSSCRENLEKVTLDFNLAIQLIITCQQKGSFRKGQAGWPSSNKQESRQNNKRGRVGVICVQVEMLVVKYLCT